MTETEFVEWHTTLQLARSAEILALPGVLIVQTLPDTVMPRIDVHFPKWVVRVAQKIIGKAIMRDYGHHLHFYIFHNYDDAYAFTMRVAEETLLVIKRW